MKNDKTQMMRLSKNFSKCIARDCFFCNINSMKIIAEYDCCYVIEDGYPVNMGHLLIISKDHVANWFEASSQLKENVVKALDGMKSYLDNEYNPDGYNIGINCGAFAGQTINHLHVHLIPRYQGDMEDPRGGVRGVIPSKQKY